MLRKIFLAFFFLFIFSFLFNFKVYATDPAKGGASEFASSYDVVYDIDPSGITTVTEKINLKNLTSEYYASQFKLIIGATQISDVKASDGGGTMQVSSQQKNNTTEINVKFNQQVAGLNKILPWTLQFKSKDFAEKIGKIWEIRAPKVSSSTNLEGYNLTISVPTQFGEPTIISPTPKSQTISSGKMFLTFEKNQLLQSGISASFGTNQLFDFDLSYHLENNNLVPILTNIALPPDTAYQDMIYQRITPAPLNVTVDDDGNYLAWYRLNRGEKKDIKVLGSSKLYTLTKVKNPSLAESLRKKYTSGDKYWEKDHPQIQSKLAEILGEKSPVDSSSNPPLDSKEKAKLIYRYVVNTLKYDSNRLNDLDKIGVERLGAVTALNNPASAVCMEFTDLFIALARTAGIPARELDGYAYSANTTLRPLSLGKDILHAWPEIWEEGKGWVMVDPTWENTTGGVDYFNKLDLNHFVFVVKGSSSTQPVPAGSYKYTGSDTQDVKVNLSDADFLGKPNLDVQISSDNPILAGFPAKLKVKISDVGNAFYPSTSFGVAADKLSILDADNKNLGPIPAFGSADFDFNIRTKSLFDNYDSEIVILVGGQKFTKKVSVKPFLIFQTAPLVAVGIVLTMVAIYTGVLGTLLYKRRFKKSK